METLRNVIRRVLSAPSHRFIHQEIPAAPDEEPRAPFEADGTYLTVRIVRFWVPKRRWAVTTYYGACSTGFTVPAIGGTAEVERLVSPANFTDLDGSDLTRCVIAPSRVLGPTPFTGVSVEMRLALFSAKCANLSAPYLSLLDEISQLFDAGHVARAATYGAVVANGVSKLLGTDRKARLEVALLQELDPPKPGLFALVAADRQAFGDGPLAVDGEHQLCRGGTPVVDHPYVLYEVRSTPERSDWFQIPDIAAAYARIEESARAGKVGETDHHLDEFTRVARTSPDMIRGDASRICELVQAKMKEVLPATKTGADAGVEVPRLQDYPLYPS